MHNDEMTPPPTAPEDRTPTPPVIQRLPATLDNWQVWDVDSAAVDRAAVDSAAVDRAAVVGEAAPDNADAPRIPDLIDAALAVTLAARHWQVAPGGAVAVPVTVLNNSTQRLTVRAHLEGWLDDRWVVDPYVQAVIPPGERRTLELTIAPPHHAQTEAGDYQLAAVIRAMGEPAHLARVGLTLTLLPFDRVQLDLADDSMPVAAWWRRTLLLPLQITNAGNRPLELRLEGAVPVRYGRVTFLGGAAENMTEVTLRPGQSARVPVRLTATRFPLIALHSRLLPFLVTACDATGKVFQQQRGAVEVQPLVGAWQLASLAGLTTIGVVAVILLAVIGALVLRTSPMDSQAAAPAAPVPAVIVVTLNQPVAVAASTAPPQSLTGALQSQPDPALPLVLPDQVTAPGSGGPARSVAPLAEVPPVAPENSVAGAPLTYAQMFQSVGAQYDLDWRMLAAQAYIESSFDALALSSAGAMGLMQVLPGTWREWAPAVGASDPFDSYNNVQVAAVYLDYLRTQLAQQGHPEKEWMLVAYNWGLDRVNDFLASGGAWQDLPDARRKYAEDILRIAQTLP